MITGPLTEMLSRNADYAVTYRQPLPLLKTSAAMRSTRAGVIVISCSDPRLNPYQILGIDAELRKFLLRRFFLRRLRRSKKVSFQSTLITG